MHKDRTMLGISRRDDQRREDDETRRRDGAGNMWETTDSRLHHLLYHHYHCHHHCHNPSPLSTHPPVTHTFIPITSFYCRDHHLSTVAAHSPLLYN
ncbi:hypothetical protein HYC85_016842 [Camellia sinensis]|uniref:Uncharacterized protein n=1 Tax=Camellia sinensis TaxID=4442 RepID=A0A7J7H461_CAMSI|nr:hypothetical protein HYC85_016842 [Camellia sinensis]